jgi:hypothetical protein
VCYYSTLSCRTHKITHIKFRKRKRKIATNFLLQLPCATNITNVITTISKSKLQKVRNGQRNVVSARLGCDVSDVKSGGPGSKLGDNKHYTEGFSGFLHSFQKHVTIAPQSVNHTFITKLSSTHSTQYNKT